MSRRSFLKSCLAVLAAPLAGWLPKAQAVDTTQDFETSDLIVFEKGGRYQDSRGDVWDFEFEYNGWAGEPLYSLRPCSHPMGRLVVDRHGRDAGKVLRTCPAFPIVRRIEVPQLEDGCEYIDERGRKWYTYYSFERGDGAGPIFAAWRDRTQEEKRYRDRGGKPGLFNIDGTPARDADPHNYTTLVSES